MSIKRDLAVGKQGEDFVKTILKSADIECDYHNGKNLATHDLRCKIHKYFTIEVKYDKMAAKTGNWAIEFHNTRSDKPSGISVTTANIWAQVVLDGENKTLWMIRVDELKKFIEEYKPHKTLTNVGDGNAAIYLYHEEIIMPFFTRVDNSKDIKSIIKKLIK